MKYAAFLKDINTRGKPTIDMNVLADTARKCGFENVSTVAENGNILFDSDQTNVEEIFTKLEHVLAEYLNYHACLIIKNYDQLKRIVADATVYWQKRDDLRCYVAFFRTSLSIHEVVREIELGQGVDFIKLGQGVIYMSTLLSGLKLSQFPKLTTKKVYAGMVIRNYDTVRKIVGIMEE
jgi:uncharacterized protein (DUF1697 family)